MDREEVCNLYIKRLNLKPGAKYCKNGIRYTIDQLDDRYVNLIGKILTKRKIQIIQKCKGKCEIIELSNGYGYGTLIHSRVGKQDPTTLFHELGHALDYFMIFNRETVVVYSYSIEINKYKKSLETILKEEIEEKGEKIVEEIYNKFEQMIDEEIGEGAHKKIQQATQLIIERNKISRKMGSGIDFLINFKGDFEAYLRDRKPSKEEEMYHALNKKFTDTGLEETLNKMYDSNAYKYIRSEYGDLLDALEYKFDFRTPYRLDMHGHGYYKKSDGGLGMEFFANMFCNLVTNRINNMKVIKKYLPISYDAFIELLNHILNTEFDIKNLKKNLDAYI